MNGKKLLKFISIATVICMLAGTVGMSAMRGGRGGGRGGGRSGGRSFSGRGGGRGGGRRFSGRGSGRRYSGRGGGRRHYGRRGGFAIGIGGGAYYGRGRRGYYGRRGWHGRRPYRRYRPYGYRGYRRRHYWPSAGWWAPYSRWGWGWGWHGPWWWWRPGITGAVVLSAGNTYAYADRAIDSKNHTWWEVANGTGNDIVIRSSNGGLYKIPAGGVGKIERGSDFDFGVQIGNRRWSASTSNHFVLIGLDAHGEISIESWAESPQE